MKHEHQLKSASIIDGGEGLRALSEAATAGLVKACPSVEGDFFGIYPDTARMEFPIAKMPDYAKTEVQQANAAFLAALWNAYRSGVFDTRPTLVPTASPPETN